ncbi:MAG TPA: hypothetical protein VIF15_05035 [Polyangiaceae bacterium]
MSACLRFALLAVLLPLLGCGNGAASPSTAQDGGTDASSAGDAAEGGCFPTCAGGDSGLPGDDAGGDGAATCDQLKAEAVSLEAAARACNPQLPSPCSASTDGICCPVSVTPGNTTAIDNFDQAVAAYKAQCTPNCAGIVCHPAPSNTCQPTQPSQGICQ